MGYPKHGNRYSKAFIDDKKPQRRGFYKPQNPIVKIPWEPMLHPTDQQTTIIDEIVNGKGNLVIKARAGTGKTKTILQGISQLPPNASGVYLVFGNRNAREAEAKMPNDNIVIATHHATGLRALKSAFGKVQVDNDKMIGIVANVVGGFEPEKEELCYNVEKAISLCKGYLAEDAETIISVCDRFGIEYCDVQPDQFADYVLQGMKDSLAQRNRLSFDDMIWMAVKLNVRLPQYDFVFCDECGDCNNGRIALTIRSVKPGGKLIFAEMIGKISSALRQLILTASIRSFPRRTQRFSR